MKTETKNDKMKTETKNDKMKTETQNDEQTKKFEKMSETFKKINNRLNNYLLRDSVSNYHFLLFVLFLGCI